MLIYYDIFEKKRIGTSPRLPKLAIRIGGADNDLYLIFNREFGALWAWTATGNLFATWPGVVMTEGSNGWFSYTFDKSVTSVNVIFSKNGSPQSEDITGVTQATCYEYDGVSGSKFTVKTSACETTAVKNIPVQQISIFPQPVKSHFVISLPNTGNQSGYTLSLFDMSGKAVKTNTFTGQTAVIGCENIRRGVYVIRIMSRDDREVYGGKLVK